MTELCVTRIIHAAPMRSRICRPAAASSALRAQSSPHFGSNSAHIRASAATTARHPASSGRSGRTRNRAQVVASARQDREDRPSSRRFPPHPRETVPAASRRIRPAQWRTRLRSAPPLTAPDSRNFPARLAEPFAARPRTWNAHNRSRVIHPKDIANLEAVCWRPCEAGKRLFRL